MSDKGIPSMGEIYQLGHAAVADLFEEEVEITEKVDGSFFSFMMDPSGELRMRSKGQALHFEAPASKMFFAGMHYVDSIKDALTPGWIYRGEFMMKPKHNTLAYERIPSGYVALFDIEVSPGDHMAAASRAYEARRLGFDSVPILFYGKFKGSGDDITAFLERDSFLGGQKIEGVVIKNFKRYNHGHILMAKLVSAAFKEKHSTEWKKSNPGRGDVIENIIEMYRVEARWNKAIQHLRDDGVLEGSPRDIGPLLKEVAQDVLKEEEEEIKAALWKYAWPQISRGITRGLPDWYKEQLLSQQFAEEEESGGGHE